MSRSTKKPYYTDRQKNRPWKQRSPKNEANRAVRTTKELASGKSYKKIFNSYDICDWSFHAPPPKDKKAHRK